MSQERDGRAGGEKGEVGEWTEQETMTEEEAIKKSSVWITIYSDLMTNLMLFFLMMFALARVDFKQLALAQASLKEAMTGKQEKILVDERKQSAKQLEFEKKIPPGWEKIAKIDMKKNGVRIVFPNPALFDLGRADLKADIKPFLDQMCAWLEDVDYRVVVDGHTDALPVVTGRYKSNWELSFYRARSVVDYMARRGLAKNRLVAAGYGEYRPVASNVNEAGRAQNRRIEVAVYYDDPEKPMEEK